MEKVILTPFICLNDFEGIDKYSKGFHSHGAPKFKIKHIRVGYPVADFGSGKFKVFTLAENQTLTAGELLRLINDFVVGELKKSDNTAHKKEDYCIEKVEILRNKAEVQFGS
jgi:hypothetical protein